MLFRSTKITPSVLPLVISTSDPFAAISQAAKGGASLVVTLSSTPGSATRGPDTDLSSEGSDDILEDLNDAPILKKRISDSDEEGSASPKPDFMGMYLSFLYLHFICILISLLVETSKRPEIAAGVGMTAPTTPVAPIPAALSAPVSAVPTTPASAVPTVFVSATPVAPIPGSFGKFPFPFISSSFSVSLLFPCHGFSFYLAFPFL